MLFSNLPNSLLPGSCSFLHYSCLFCSPSRLLQSAVTFSSLCCKPAACCDKKPLHRCKRINWGRSGWHQSHLSRFKLSSSRSSILSIMNGVSLLSSILKWGHGAGAPGPDTCIIHRAPGEEEAQIFGTGDTAGGRGDPGQVHHGASDDSRTATWSCPRHLPADTMLFHRSFLARIALPYVSTWGREALCQGRLWLHRGLPTSLDLSTE